MKKTILITLLSILSFSCSEKKENDKLIEKLKNENDSLKSIIAEINEKYVFDQITIRDIPSYKNTNKLNSTVAGEIVFVGYNLDSKSRVILVDSFSYNPKKLYNPDTLKLKQGGFIYKAKLKSSRQDINGILELDNKFGKKYDGFFKTTIATKRN